MQATIETSFDLSQLQVPNCFIYYLYYFLNVFKVLGIWCLPDNTMLSSESSR